MNPTGVAVTAMRVYVLDATDTKVYVYEQARAFAYHLHGGSFAVAVSCFNW